MISPSRPVAPDLRRDLGPLPQIRIGDDLSGKEFTAHRHNLRRALDDRFPLGQVHMFRGHFRRAMYFTRIAARAPTLVMIVAH